MKKWCLGILCFACIYAADSIETQNIKEEVKKEQNIDRKRYFIGVGVGYGVSRIDSTNTWYHYGESTKAASFWGIYFGEEFQVSNKVLVRTDTSIGGTSVEYSDGELNTITLGINIDLLYNIASQIDIFAGLGLGFNFFSGELMWKLAERGFKSTSGDWNPWINLGVRKVFNDKHSLELFAKMPILPTTIIDSQSAYNYLTGTTGTLKIQDRTYILGLAYKYLFGWK